MSAYREESVVRLSYTIEADDLRAAWLPVRAGWFHVMRLTVAATVALMGVVYVLTLAPVPAAVALALVGALSGYFALKAKVLADPTDAYGERWEDHRHCTLEVTEDIFAIGNRVTESRIAWELVLHWRETQDAFLIYTSPSHFHVIPRRAFPKKELETTMRQLLTDRVAPGGDAAIAASERMGQIPLAAYYVVLTLVLGAFGEAIARLAS